MRHAPRIVLIAFALGVGAASMRGAAGQPSDPAVAGQPIRLTGTVRALQIEARTCDLLTGVGHSLRMRRIHLPTGLKVKTRSGESQVSALLPGSIVRVECQSTPEGAVASTVELLEAPAAARKR